jgi:hypothetical protein
MVEDEPRQRAKKQMMVLLQAGQPWPRSCPDCRSANQSIYCLPVAPTVPHTRSSGLARWEAWAHHQDAQAHPGVAGIQVSEGGQVGLAPLFRKS